LSSNPSFTKKGKRKRQKRTKGAKGIVLACPPLAGPPERKGGKKKRERKPTTSLSEKLSYAFMLAGLHQRGEGRKKKWPAPLFIFTCFEEREKRKGVGRKGLSLSSWFWTTSSEKEERRRKGEEGGRGPNPKKTPRDPKSEGGGEKERVFGHLSTMPTLTSINEAAKAFKGRGEERKKGGGSEGFYLVLLRCPRGKGGKGKESSLMRALPTIVSMNELWGKRKKGKKKKSNAQLCVICYPQPQQRGEEEKKERVGVRSLVSRNGCERREKGGDYGVRSSRHRERGGGKRDLGLRPYNIIDC